MPGELVLVFRGSYRFPWTEDLTKAVIESITAHMKAYGIENVSVKDDELRLERAKVLQEVRKAANLYAYHWYTDDSDRLGLAIVDAVLKAVDPVTPAASVEQNAGERLSNPNSPERKP